MQLLDRVAKYEQGNLYGATRDAWDVLAVLDYVRADWEDDMEPGAVGDLQPNKGSLYMCSFRSLVLFKRFVTLLATVNCMYGLSPLCIILWRINVVGNVIHSMYDWEDDMEPRGCW